MSSNLDLWSSILLKYYNPLIQIEHKYRTKITAVGLLKNAKLSHPRYLSPYAMKLNNYKELLDAHWQLNDSMGSINGVYESVLQNMFESVDYASLNDLTRVLYSSLEEDSDDEFRMRKEVFENLQTDDGRKLLSDKLYGLTFFDDTHYNEFIHSLNRICLSGLKQEEVISRIEEVTYNAYLFRLPSRTMNPSFFLTLQDRSSITKPQDWSCLNTVLRYVKTKIGDYYANVNVFMIEDKETLSKIRNFYESIRNINVMFY